MHAVIGHHLDSVQVCRSFLQENTRLTISSEILEAHIENIRSTVVGKWAELVFNFNEVGSSEWEDRRVQSVVIPA
jgi:hypothetical protein